MTEDHLYDIFETFGEIQSIDLPLNKTCMGYFVLYTTETLLTFPVSVMTNRGTAYILYHDAADAEAAVSNMHEAQIDGAVLKVSIVLPKRMFSRSPPPARRPGPDDRSVSPRRHLPGHEYPSRASPPPRRRSTRHPVNGGLDRHDIYRPRSLSRSVSPRRSRARSYSRSDSGSSPRRRSPPRRRSRNRRRRSPSYSSYSSRASSYSDRSRSLSRNRTQRSNNRRR